jgi:hypothetical protein
VWLGATEGLGVVFWVGRTQGISTLGLAYILRGAQSVHESLTVTATVAIAC